LQVDAELLKKSLQTRLMVTKNERYDVPNNKVQAGQARDALAKALYSRIFDYIIEQTNIALNKFKMAFACVIGVLDIYGFEIFDKNGFEQFCINFVNEKLQQYFIELTLKAEQEEYNSEGIQWTPIKFFNNKIVCELIEGKKPPGIFSILDDVCAQMHALGSEPTQGQSVDLKFLDKASQFCSENLHFYRQGTAFAVKHYAGEVKYECEGFCEKNKDILNVDLITCMQSSSMKFLNERFPDNVTDINKRPSTSGYKIKTSAGELMAALSACKPHYVRTIKPNDTKKPGDWDSARIRHQVQYLGLLENVRVRRAGFCFRAPYERFLNRYKKLSEKTWGTWGEWSGDGKEGTTIILSSTPLDQKQFQYGKTKIFIRHPESLFYLEESLERHDYECASIIQKAWRKYVAKKLALEQRRQAANLFKGKKERRRDSVNMKFSCDYMNYDKNYLLQEALGGGREERVIFADQVIKLNRRLRPERRDLVITVEAVYVCMRCKKNNQEYYKLTRRNNLNEINSLSVSSFQDNFIVFRFNSDDLVIENSRKTEIVAVLYEYYEKKSWKKDSS